MKNKYEIIWQSKLSFEDKLKRCDGLIKHEVDKTINKNILNIYKDKLVWTEVIYKFKNKEDSWINHVSYYYGDLRKTEKSDWRFCDVEDKRIVEDYSKLVMHNTSHNLKQNHSRDYINWLRQK
jgi:hypothetical protein